MTNRYHSFDDLPLTMRVEELMPILGIGRNTAYDLVRCGAIRSIKIGRQLRIPKQALIDYLTAKDSRQVKCGRLNTSTARVIPYKKSLVEYLPCKSYYTL